MMIVNDMVFLCRFLALLLLKRKQIIIYNTCDTDYILRKFQHVFAFDEVFNDDSSNEDVYRRAVRPLLEGVFRR